MSRRVRGVSADLPFVTGCFLVDDPEVGITSILAVGDSAVGTPLLFLRIACSSRDCFRVGDSTVGITSILAVGDSAVSTPLFSANLWSKVGLLVNV